MLFLHPECPCSRATIAEVSRLATSCGDRLAIEAYVYAPKAMPSKWAKSGLYESVKELPGAQVTLDEDGKIARAYKVKTSGQALLYSPDGHLVFSGGLTASRAHEGDNAGIDSVKAYVMDGKAELSSTPVFGCSFGFSDDGASGDRAN